MRIGGIGSLLEKTFIIILYFLLQMEYTEFTFEAGQEVLRSQLEAVMMSREEYATAHASLPIVCHDVAIFYHGSVLLVKRDNLPAKGEWFVIGGRVERGVMMEESLRRKVKVECGLEVVDVEFLGVARTLFATDPFGHGRGTDTINFFYVARGRGVLKLDDFHSSPRLLKEEEFTTDVKKELHPYVVEILEKAFERMKKKGCELKKL